MELFLNSIIWSATHNPTSPIGYHIKNIHITVKEIKMTLQRFILLQRLCPNIEIFDYVQELSDQSYTAIPGWPHLKSISRIYSDPFHQLMDRYANQLTHLELTPNQQCSLPFLPSLQYLTLVYTDINSTDFNDLYSKFPRLVSLTLENCVLPEININQPIIQQNQQQQFDLDVENKSPSPIAFPLKILKLNTVDIVDYKWFEYFGSNYPLLEKLYINGAYTIKIVNIEEEREYFDSFAEMIIQFKQLKTLHVADAMNICHKYILVKKWIKTPTCKIEDLQLERINIYGSDFQQRQEQRNKETNVMSPQYLQLIDTLKPTLKSLRLTTQTINYSSDIMDFISPFYTCSLLTQLFLDVGDIEGKYSEWQPVHLPLLLNTCKHLLNLTVKHGPIITKTIDKPSSPSFADSLSNNNNNNNNKIEKDHYQDLNQNDLLLLKNKIIKLELIGCSFDSSLFDYLNKTCRGLIRFSIQWKLGECPLPWRITPMGTRSLDINLSNIGLETLTLNIPLIVDQGYIGKSPMVLLLANEQYNGQPQYFRLNKSQYDVYWKRNTTYRLDGQEGLIQVSCRYLEDLIF
ncbi:unnamed protein product [Cunninghamella blakesleeana]